MSNPSDFLISEDEYCKKESNSVLQTFAIVKDGKWYEKGKMGWFACVSNENPEWNKEFDKLFNSLPDETLISLYDCDI